MNATACRTTHERPLLVRLLRGIVGICLLAVAAWMHEPFVAMAAFLAAFVAFGGCPMCWTLGLVELASQKLKPFVPGKDSP